MEGVDDGYSKVAEAFCSGEACKGRVEDRSGYVGWLRLGSVRSHNGGCLMEKTSTEVLWQVCGDILRRDLCSPWYLSTGELE